MARNPSPSNSGTKILFYNDPHIADRPPAGRIDDYATNVLAKLEEIRQMAVRLKVDAAVCTGDIWHQKRANRVSHRLVNRLIEHYQQYPPEIVRRVVPGNHDLPPEGVAGIHRQPIWTLHESGAIQVFDFPIYVGDDVCLIPRAWDSERAADPDYYKLTDEEKDGKRFVVLVAHGPILPPGAEHRVYDSLRVDEIDLDGIDAVICGHCHENLGIHYADSKKTKHYANVGSITRNTRTQSNLARQPSVVLLETNGAKLQLTRHGLKNVLPAGEIFEDRPLDQEEGIDDAMAQLVDRLAGGLRSEEQDIHELLAEYGELSSPAMKLVVHFLEMGGLL